jgi:hypothetical protein
MWGLKPSSWVTGQNYISEETLDDTVWKADSLEAGASEEAATKVQKREESAWINAVAMQTDRNK